MTQKRLSLLSYRPDWRYKAALSKKTTLEDCNDPIVIRYLKAKADEFKNDLELLTVITMGKKDRGLIEALRLGGAPIREIAKYTMTKPEVVELALGLFYDVDPILDSPLLRTQMAQKEASRPVRSYKTYVVKYGWKKFIDQFMSNEEIRENPPSPSETQTNMLIELERKISEIGMFDTGSIQSKELLSWMSLLLKLFTEMRATDWDKSVDTNIDISLIMKAMDKNSELSKDRESFEFFNKFGDIEDESGTEQTS